MERTAGTPDGEYVNNTKFYDGFTGTLETLAVRAATIPKNQIITQQINLLKENLEKLRELHIQQKEKGLTQIYIDSIRTAFDAQFASIYKLEERLKEGAPVSNK